MDPVQRVWRFQNLVWNGLTMIKSMINSCLPEFSDFTRVFSPVKVLCNGPLLEGNGETLVMLTPMDCKP